MTLTTATSATIQRRATFSRPQTPSAVGWSLDFREDNLGECVEFEIIKFGHIPGRGLWTCRPSFLPFIYTNGPLRLLGCQRCGDVSGEGKGHWRWHLHRPQINAALYLQATHGRRRSTAISFHRLFRMAHTESLSRISIHFGIFDISFALFAMLFLLISFSWERLCRRKWE